MKIISNINYYGIILVLNFLISILYIIKKASNKHLSSKEIFYMILYIMLGIIIGGKYYTILSHYQTYKDANFLSVGLSSLGSLLGSIFMLYLFTKQFRKKQSDIFNIFIPVLPLLYGIGKIGCFLSGCCLGFKYTGFLSVTYSNGSFFPVQLLESLVFITIFIYINKLNKKQDKYLVSKCLIICGLSKFLLEFLRLRTSSTILNINQIVCIFLILFGILIIIKNYKNKPKVLYKSQ